MRGELRQMHLIELETPLFADTILEIGDDQLNCHSFAVQDLESLPTVRTSQREAQRYEDQ